MFFPVTIVAGAATGPDITIDGDPNGGITPGPPGELDVFNGGPLWSPGTHVVNVPDGYDNFVGDDGRLICPGDYPFEVTP